MTHADQTRTGTLELAPSETIAALVTPSGVGGVAVVRLSGPASLATARHLLAPRWQSLDSAARQFFHAVLRDPATGQRIDEAVVLVFPSPHSYTGEEVVELQVHGGRLPARRLLDALGALGARMALPGEFTRRAFVNGRIDLSQAEAVMDLIGAQSDRAAHVAIEQLQGALRRRVDALYEELMALCADLEATLDFGEDEVPESLSSAQIAARIAGLQAHISRLLSTWREGHLLRDGALVVISGRPNAGKSALFNALLGRDRAIVADQPGTTRDTLEEALTLDGVPLRLVDTAGLRETDCDVERQGVERATEVVGRADLHLRVVDLGGPWNDEDLATLRDLPPARTVVALNKADRHAPAEIPPLPAGYRGVAVSALTGQGLDGLRAALQAALGLAGHGDADIAVGARHRDLLVQAAAALHAAHARCAETGDAVLTAQALRDAADALGGITGRNVGEDVLDHVFARFCVGK
jgi:tRNA modification GTPase